MIKIRRGVFETNSSSMHSIAVVNNDRYETVEYYSNLVYHNSDNPNNYNVCGCFGTADMLDFGRYPFNILFDFEDKVRYAFASFSDDPNCKEFEEIKRIITKYTGCKNIVFPTQTDWKTHEEKEYYGYVDHQSADLLLFLLTKNNISMEEFLTNKKYIVIIDGDEYCIWDKIKESGVVNESAIEKEY